MPVPVYYNFAPIYVSLEPEDYSKKEIILKTPPNTPPNLRLNDINYFAKSLYITKQSGQSGTPYLIIKCMADSNDDSSDVLLFAITLTSGPTESDVDNLMKGGTNVELDLHKYLKPGDAKVSSAQNHVITVVVSKDTCSIPVNGSFANSYKSAINNLQLNANTDATIAKQDLDWVLSCDLLDENGIAYPNPTMNEPAAQVDSANTITFLMMSLMIAGSAYLIGPTVYNLGGLFKLAKVLGRGSEDGSTKPNHYTLNLYWGILLILAAVMCIVQGGIMKKDLYYFLAIGLIFSYFAATSAILKLDGVANEVGTGFRNTSGMFKYFGSINSPESELTVAGLPSMIRIIAAVCFYLGFILGLVFMILGVSNVGKDPKVFFSVGIILFLALPGISMLMVANYIKSD